MLLIQVLAWDRHKHAVRLNRLMEPPSTLDLNSNDNNINNNLSPLSVHKNKQGMKQTQEKFEETKRIIISQKSKDRQYNGQKKKEKKCLTFKKIVKIEMTFCSLNLLKYIPYLGD